MKEAKNDVGAVRLPGAEVDSFLTGAKLRDALPNLRRYYPCLPRRNRVAPCCFVLNESNPLTLA